MQPILEPLLKIALLIVALMTGAAYLVLLERWIAAWVQDRLGPNRVGIPLTKYRLFGLGQPLADGVKFLFKAEFTPSHVDKALFFVAPLAIFITSIVVFAVIPFGSVLPPDGFPASWGIHEPIRLVAAPGVDVGMIYVFAVGSIAVYGVVLGGWASNNKYSFIGGMRSSAQLISYELPLGLGILGVVLASGSLRLDTIISQQAQAGVWNVFTQPLGFVVFCVAAFAEAARLPFDLPEAEQELVGGYHTEYSGIKLMMYMVAEFLHMVAAAFLIVILFFGGWHLWGVTGDQSGTGPFFGQQTSLANTPQAENMDLSPSETPAQGGQSHFRGGNAGEGTDAFPAAKIGTVPITWPVALLRIIVLLAKVMAVILFFMMARWSWPRFRYDQLMDVGWKVMIPWGLVNLVVVAVWMEYGDRLTRLLGVSPAKSMALVGWIALFMSWLVITVIDPTSSRNRPRPRLPAEGDFPERT
jgi:NADH-quinone oxidoreductase subunit H